MKLGACLNLTICVADIIDSGGAVGVWDADAGTFTVQLEASQGVTGEASEACGGSNANRQWSELTLRLNGSGSLGIAISGTGENRYSNYEAATAVLNGDQVMLYDSAGGDATDCGGVPLVSRQDDSPFTICPCSLLVLRWDTLDELWHGAWTCTFTLSVL